MNSHLQKPDRRTQEVKPIYEQVLEEIIELRREFSKRLDRTEVIIR
jgi:hypothetical protein